MAWSQCGQNVLAERKLYPNWRTMKNIFPCSSVLSSNKRNTLRTPTERKSFPKDNLNIAMQKLHRIGEFKKLRQENREGEKNKGA